MHSTWLATGLADGIGFTNTVAVIVGPGQLFAVGVMVNVTSCGTKVILINVPVIGLDDPDAATPVAFTKLSLVQLYVVPNTSLVSTIGVIGEPEHTD